MATLSNVPDGVSAETLPFFEAARQYDSRMIATDGVRADHKLPGFLYLSLPPEDVRSTVINEDVYTVHRAHDLAVLAVEASGGVAHWREIVEGLHTHLGFSRYEVDFSLRHALALNTLALKIGGMLVKDKATDFDSLN